MRRWHGLTWRGWAVFLPGAALLFCAVFWGTVKVAAVVDPGTPAITQSPAGVVGSAPTKGHPRHPAVRPASRPASHRAPVSHPATPPEQTPGQARIPGVGNGYGITSVPPSTRYQPPTSPGYVRRTPVPVTSTPEPAPDPPPSSAPEPSSEAPSTTEPPPDTSGPGWGARPAAARTSVPDSPVPDLPNDGSLPGVPGGSSGWLPGG
jgi:hypothetical protein